MATWKQYCTDPKFAYTFENQFLYEMCMRYPAHDCPYTTAGKVTAIGRIYSASPERGAGQAKKSLEEKTLVRQIGEQLANSKLDAELNNIDFTTQFSFEIIEKLVNSHRTITTEVTKAIESWSRKDDGVWIPRECRSFASKYLHFHRPNAFPIMDSYAISGLRYAGHKRTFETYQDFCHAFSDYTKSLPAGWTPRSVDDCLVRKGRKHEESKKRKELPPTVQQNM